MTLGKQEQFREKSATTMPYYFKLVSIPFTNPFTRKPVTKIAGK
jgi:hypothetical protein